MWVNGRATRSWREGTPDSYVHEPTIVFDPVHYLALIERKINALDQAAPLARCARSAWGAPVRGDIARARAGRTTVRPPSLSVATLAVTGAWCGPDALVAIPARPEGEGSATLQAYHGPKQPAGRLGYESLAPAHLRCAADLECARPGPMPFYYPASLPPSSRSNSRLVTP
jgi:hypothetical protein